MWKARQQCTTGLNGGRIVCGNQGNNVQLVFMVAVLYVDSRATEYNWSLWWPYCMWKARQQCTTGLYGGRIVCGKQGNRIQLVFMVAVLYVESKAILYNWFLWWPYCMWKAGQQNTTSLYDGRIVCGKQGNNVQLVFMVAVLYVESRVTEYN